MKTKAAVLVKTGAPLWVTDDVEIPKLASGQVLVCIEYSGVCHSQLMEADGHRGVDRWLPHMLGHEASGEVVETGPDVTTVSKGQNVVLSWIKGAGIDAPGARYRCGKQIINAGPVTTFSRYSVVSENRCTALPAHMPLDVASLLGCAVLTGFGAVMNTLRPKAGENIAIFGLGGIGLCALMAARASGLDPIIAIDVAPAKLELAREFGATHTVNVEEQEPVQFVNELIPGGVDYAVDASGRTDVIEQAFASVRRFGGRCVFASHPPAGQLISLDPFELISGKRIQGTWGGESKPTRDIPLLGEHYAAGRLPVERLISRRYSLAQVNEAMDALRTRTAARPLIDMNLV